MNIFFYFIIFTIGILFGSFYTLAVYRIPRKEDITHTHSYCPNCNAKLGFFELIPVLSYIFLGGKCKHCGEKIRARYIILELLSGTLFVIFALILGLDVYNLDIKSILTFAFFALFTTYIVLTLAIYKEHKRVEKSVLYYGIVITIMYMVYLYILK
ncbi:MAG: prepilin peptidase [Clostridia bacterium]|nr:prepilin peptidase [Clostridia bacterium]